MILALVCAAILQVLGTCILAFEAVQVRRRWKAKFQPGKGVQSLALRPAIEGDAAVAIEVEVRATGVVLSVDDRVGRLEQLVEQENRAIRAEISELRQSVPITVGREAATQVAGVEERLQPQIAETLEYLAGLGHRPTWNPWWLGPALLAAGTILSGVAGIWSLL